FRKMIQHNALITQSMSRKANCYDNAVAESFFKSLKVEAIYRRCFGNNLLKKRQPILGRVKKQAEIAVFEYIETWYNTHRRHSALGGLSINEFENINTLKHVA
ncbi:MAG: IS3 family transposase, partial [Bacteroidota bacterium]